jgi:hypothetical protein
VVYGQSVIPGGDLVSQGAAAAAGAARLPGLEALKAQADVAQAAAKGTQALADLEAKRPELHDTIMDAIHQIEMDKFKARLDARQVAVQESAQNLYGKQFGETVRHHVAGEVTATQRANTATKTYRETVRKHNADIKKANKEGNKVNAAASKDLGYLVDQYGNPIKDAKGNKIKVTSPVAKTRKPGGKVYGQAVGKADELRRRNSGGTDKFGDPTPAKNPITRRAALRLIMGRYGMTRAQAVKAMKDAGWDFPPPPRQPRGPLPGTGPR